MSEWMARAACRGRDVTEFFPDRAADAGPALDVCKGCPVRDECLAAGTEGRESGVWGGTFLVLGRPPRRAGQAA